METNSFPRWLILTSSLALLILALGGAWFYRSQEWHLQRQAEEGLQTIAALKAGQIAGWRAERLDDATMLMHSPFLLAGVARYLSGSVVEDKDELLTSFRALKDYYHYSNVLLVARDKRVCLSLSEPAKGISADAVSQALSDAWRSRRPGFADLHTDEVDSSPHISVIVPVFGDAGQKEEPIGAILLISEARQFLYPLIQSWPTSSKTAETLLVRREGDAVLFLNDTRHQKNVALKLRIPLSRRDVPAVMAALGREGIVPGRDYRGVEVLSALKTVPDSPWFLVAKIDAAEALGEWRFRSLLILALILSGIVTLAFVAVVGWQRNLKVHYRALYESEASCRRSEEQLRDRVKELNCLYGIADLIEHENSLEKILQGSADLMPHSWLYPEITCARIIFNGRHYQTGNFRETDWRQSASLEVNGQPAGMIDLCYLEERPIKDEGPFLREERSLINAIAERLGGVAERKHSEEEVARTAREWQLTFDSTNDAIWVLGKDHRILRSNKAAERIFHRPHGELIGKHCCEIVHGTTKPIPECPILRTRESLLRETRELQIGEDWFEVTVDPILDSSGGYAGAVHFVSDITGRKRSEAYREMGRELLQILNQPGDPQDSIQRVLAALKTRTGFDAVGIRMQDGDDFPYFAQKGFSADFLRTENTLIERAANGGVCRDKDGNVSLECTCGLIISGKTDPANPLFTPGGSAWTNDSFPFLEIPPGDDPRLHPRNECIHQGYASVALVPIRSKVRIVGLIQLNDRRKGRFTIETIEILEGIASHIGEALMRKQMESELLKTRASLEKTNQALRKLDQLKSDFVSTVSHELRTPLTSIREAISQVEDGIVGQISREQHEVLSIALEEVDRLARLINDVLDISQIEAGIISLQKSEFAISACLKKIEASFSRTITEKRLKLTIKVDQPVPRVYADPDKFDQILTNIIGNAVKFTHSGGEIVIAVLKKESCTEFRISDTGIGISPDNLKRLFVKFQQFGQPAEGSPRGTGLGLAITKELVEMHGGLIRATSSLGQGTCITFTMPVAEKA